VVICGCSQTSASYFFSISRQVRPRGSGLMTDMVAGVLTMLPPTNLLMLPIELVIPMSVSMPGVEST